MREEGQLPFLARTGYRRRRLIEAIRLLPVVATVVIALPLLWTGNSDAPASTSNGGIYIFLSWLFLIFAAFISSRAYRRTEAKESEDNSDLL